MLTRVRSSTGSLHRRVYGHGHLEHPTRPNPLSGGRVEMAMFVPYCHSLAAQRLGVLSHWQFVSKRCQSASLVVGCL